MKNLDFSLPIEERVKLVTNICDSETPPKQDLEKMADYIIDGMSKQEKKEKEILTSNRMVTINKRETSYQGMAEKFEIGEDAIYNMLSDLGRVTLLTPKIGITEEDLEEIPGLRELKEDIEETEAACKAATGKKKYLLKKQLIEMRQQQYVMKEGYRKPMAGRLSRSGLGLCQLDLSEDIEMVDGEPVSHGMISLFNSDHVSALLNNYAGLKSESEGRMNSDIWFLMNELDGLIERALKREDFLRDIVALKIEGRPNIEIKAELLKRHGYTHSVEYISSLWRNKIPKLLADKAKEEYILWYYTNVEKGVWKKCSRCGEVKLAHNRWFSKNKSSKDGWYTICKDCRNAKPQK